MATLKKYLVVMLSTVFVTSLVLQVCCHSNEFELLNNEYQQEETAAQGHPHKHDKKSSDDDCSSHQFKNLFKSEKLSVSSNPSVSSFASLFHERSVYSGTEVLKSHSSRLIFFNKAGPPIYLLNSVFLN